MGYTKLFSEILDSSVWNQPDHVRLLWITMLAMRDKDHHVMASIPGLANRARISLSDCQEALEILSSPDEFSRDKDNEGRRIEEVYGGWKIINAEKYRSRMSLAERREHDRLRKRMYREKRKQSMSETCPGQSETCPGQSDKCPRHVRDMSQIVPTDRVRVRVRDIERDIDKDIERDQGEISPLEPLLSAPKKNDRALLDEELVHRWNKMARANGLPAVRALGTDRAKKFATRLKDALFCDVWRDAITAIPDSKFLRGENDRGWRANLEWFLRPGNAIKVAEGDHTEKSQDLSPKPVDGWDDWIHEATEKGRMKK